MADTIIIQKDQLLNNTEIHRKRPAEGEVIESEESPTKPKRQKSDVNINLNEKNPISILNELRLGLKYEVIEQTGPSHNPLFKVSVDVDGQTYYGTGNSKKAAKSEAATEALKSFIQFPNNGAIVSTNSISKAKIDFTSDMVVNKGGVKKKNI
ncbi:hypothetical protein NQ317_011390 [Molorchus minor]|uniref:DRBM domain-containing protein n=1 Tax=Molorchus minor TaxID=1323400 RepID=A0ABQ9JS65_9CUCU|nr:hypothetical protein NQ317_011390 [Molorchus minor]